MGSTCRAKTAYKSAYPDPLKLRPGDRLTIGARQTDWAGWLWCTDGRGVSGWIPETYLRRDGDTAVMLVEYDATELAVSEGEVVEVLLTESGWAKCRRPDGRTGWLPLEVLESPSLPPAPEP